MPLSSVWVIAHRGASGHAPENTLAAVARALELDADAIECDVHLSRDGVPVVFHDEDTERLTGVPGTVGRRSLTELRTLAVQGLGPGSIPTLTEWLAAVGPCHPVIEIKTDRVDYPGIEAAVWREIEAAGAGETAVSIAFDLDTLERLRELAPQARLGPIFLGRPPEKIWPRIAALSPFVIVYDGEALDAEDVRVALDGDWQAWAYTLNAPEHIRAGLAAGLTGIITNYPERARAEIARPPRKP